MEAGAALTAGKPPSSITVISRMSRDRSPGCGPKKSAVRPAPRLFAGILLRFSGLQNIEGRIYRRSCADILYLFAPLLRLASIRGDPNVEFSQPPLTVEVDWYWKSRYRRFPE